MAGPEVRRCRTHPGIQGDELRHERVQLAVERGASLAEAADPLAPGGLADRADNEAWVREYLDRPLTRQGIEALLAG